MKNYIIEEARSQIAHFKRTVRSQSISSDF